MSISFRIYFKCFMIVKLSVPYTMSIVFLINGKVYETKFGEFAKVNQLALKLSLF